MRDAHRGSTPAGQDPPAPARPGRRGPHHRPEADPRDAGSQPRSPAPRRSRSRRGCASRQSRRSCPGAWRSPVPTPARRRPACREHRSRTRRRWASTAHGIKDVSDHSSSASAIRQGRWPADLTRRPTPNARPGVVTRSWRSSAGHPPAAATMAARWSSPSRCDWSARAVEQQIDHSGNRSEPFSPPCRVRRLEWYTGHRYAALRLVKRCSMALSRTGRSSPGRSIRYVSGQSELRADRAEINRLYAALD